VNRKHISGHYDDMDDDEVLMLGSRFLHAVHDNSRREPHRLRSEEFESGKSRRIRPRPVRDRS